MLKAVSPPRLQRGGTVRLFATILIKNLTKVRVNCAL